MTGELLAGRLRDAGLSEWEAGDLLGVHPHLVGAPPALLRDQPLRVLIEIARRLDIHPADLVPELGPLLAARREPGPDASGSPPADALAVLAALATSWQPLTCDQLADALGWDLARTAGALAAAQGDPALGGPLALRREPGDAWTVTPRLDILTTAQQQALREQALRAEAAGTSLDKDQAAVLLAVLATDRGRGNYAAIRARAGWARAEAALKDAGLICGAPGPHRARASEDVRFSLRYRDDGYLEGGPASQPPA